ncbi:MAG: PIG-L family deacetylase [Syntrophaceae bacterium]|nr:PIG-L family deacetylase [Syntrophaceae bacterium]
MDREAKRALAFGTHPDDIEIGCGGTVALLAQRGFDITHVILTSGEAGSDRIPRGDGPPSGAGGPRGREGPRRSRRGVPALP